MQILDLPARADPIEILAVDGGSHVTDAFEVFPKLEKGTDGNFRCRFFLHGWRYVNSTAQTRLDRVAVDDRLHVTLELSNPVARVAVQLQTLDYHVIGWAPRYLVKDSHDGSGRESRNVRGPRRAGQSLACTVAAAAVDRAGRELGAATSR